MQSISGDRISPTRQTDINNSLAGKIAGVQVLSQAGSNLGASTAIRIRGAGSLNDKAPLYVVDGTPVDGTNLFLSPDDMESITVLKGPNATALYGQRGDAGVVVITTKRAKGNNGIGLEVNHTTSFERPSLLPNYQNVYGGGGDSQWQTFKWQTGYPEEWKAFDGKKYHDYTDDSSWGPKMDGSEYIPWYAWYPGTPYSNQTASFTPQPDNVKKFFNTGHTYNSNISAVSLTSTTALQQIGTQKWIALYPNGYEAWAEWRRTGYPALTPTPYAVNVSKQIPRRYGYPTSEQTLNKTNYDAAVARLQGGDTHDARVWWDVK